VGRDDELRLVKDLLHATAREQRARLVSVTGVPGIGKSRLAWEFLKYVDGLAEVVYWHQGRSASYGEGVAFGALGEMVRMRAGINEVETADAARQKLAVTVAEFVTDELERSWIEPKLAHLLGLAEAPSSDRDELFNAWRTFFERISSFGLTVMVFEDLQWADPGMIDFVESILEWSRSYPIMVVTLSRPELLDRRADWGAGQRSFTSLHLDPLEGAAMRALLEGFVRGLPDAVTTSVLARAEGVPLYAVETVRMLVDRGVLVEDEGSYRVEGEIESLDIPETLHALVASRLDSLPGEQRALLQDAAVLGNSFLPESLAAVHGGERSALDVHLRDLVRKEFLRFDSDPRSPERGQYGFVQAVISEIAVNMLSRRDRSAKHLVAAQYYESFDDEELTAIVAAHYGAAFRASPEATDTGEMATKAGEWLERAGERALSLGSPEQAYDLFNQALEITPSGSRRAALLEAAAEATSRSNDHEGAKALLDEAVLEHEALGDHLAVGLATAKVATQLTALRRREEALALAESAYNKIGPDGDLNARAHLALAAAGALGQGADTARSLEWAELALTFAEQLDDTTLLAQALGARSFALFFRGRHREAAMLARGMVTLAIEAGSLREQAVALLGLSLYALPDDPHETFTVALESAEISRRAGLRGIEDTNLMNCAETAIELGRWEEARSMLKELATRIRQKEPLEWLDYLNAMLLALSGEGDAAVAIVESKPINEMDATMAGTTTRLHAHAMVHYATGYFEGARDLASRAVEMDPVGINSPAAIALQARASIWMHDVDGLRRAFQSSHAVRGRWMAAARAEMEAALAALEGRPTEAGELYTMAIDSWRALNCTLDVAITELELVHLLGSEHPDAVSAKEARDIFTQIGALPYLARLDIDAPVER
jgi:tetratricopeptide (TPR) repeat protein